MPAPALQRDLATANLAQANAALRRAREVQRNTTITSPLAISWPGSRTDSRPSVADNCSIHILTLGPLTVYLPPPVDATGRGSARL